MMPDRTLARCAAVAVILLSAQPTHASADPAPDAAVVREAERRMDVIDKNETLVKELAAMGAMDQLVRERWLELHKTADAPTRAALVEVWDRRIKPIDAANARRMRELMAGRSEWFRISEVGEPAALAAYLIVQHADLRLQKAALALMEPLLASGEANKSNYATMFDRVAIQEGRPQRYATQGTDCDGDRYVTPRELEDPANLDARRAAMGLEPMAEHLKIMNRLYGRCEVPPVMRNRAKAK
jgi:hypothetical protein